MDLHSPHTVFTLDSCEAHFTPNTAKQAQGALPLNTVQNTDCIQFMRSLPEKSVHLIMSDPPYDFKKDTYIKHDKQGKFKKAFNAKLHDINAVMGLSYNPEEYLNECKRICTIFNGYFFCNKALLPNYLNWVIAQRFSYDILLWHKPTAMPSHNGHYNIDKEYCVFIRQQGATFHSRLHSRLYSTVKVYSRSRRTQHPTEKPLNFMKECILVSSNKGDVVFDGYMGSGTTALASLETGRSWLGCELSEEYCRIANEQTAQAAAIVDGYAPLKKQARKVAV